MDLFNLCVQRLQRRSTFHQGYKIFWFRVTLRVPQYLHNQLAPTAGPGNLRAYRQVRYILFSLLPE